MIRHLIVVIHASEAFYCNNYLLIQFNKLKALSCACICCSGMMS